MTTFPILWKIYGDAKRANDVVHYVRHNCALRCRGEWDLIKSYKTMRKRKINVLENYVYRQVFSRKHVLISHREPGEFVPVTSLIDMGHLTPADPHYPVQTLRRANCTFNDPSVSSTVENRPICNPEHLTFPMVKPPVVITISPVKPVAPTQKEVSKNASERKKAPKKKRTPAATKKTSNRVDLETQKNPQKSRKRKVKFFGFDWLMPLKHLDPNFQFSKINLFIISSGYYSKLVQWGVCKWSIIVLPKWSILVLPKWS